MESRRDDIQEHGRPCHGQVHVENALHIAHDAFTRCVEEDHPPENKPHTSGP